MPTLAFLFNVVLDVLATSIRKKKKKKRKKRKEIKEIQIGKEYVKLSLFAEDIKILKTPP